MYGKRYKGKEPCPGCGKSANTNLRPALMSICDECSKFLRRGKNQKDDAGEYCRVDWGDGTGDVYLKEYDDQGRSIPDQERLTGSPRYISDLDSKDGNSRNLHRAIDEVFAAADLGERKAIASIRKSDGYGYRGNYYISKRIAVAMFNLYREIALYSRSNYGEGFREGQDLIGGLAAGTITIEDMNDRVVRANKYSKSTR